MKKKDVYKKNELHEALENMQDALISLKNSKLSIGRMIENDISKNGVYYSKACDRMVSRAKKIMSYDDILSDLKEIRESLDSLEDNFDG